MRISSGMGGASPSPMYPWALYHRRTKSLSSGSGSLPAANRSPYVSARQKREESGVWISSMTTMRPSGVRPNSYFVSTRMRPRSAQRLWPASNSFMASTAASSKSFAVTFPVARISSRAPHTSCSPLGGFGVGGKNGGARLWGFLQTFGEAVSAEHADALLVVGPEARRRGAGRVRANHHLDEDRLALDALQHVGIGHPDDMIRDDALRLLDPPRGEPVQHLPLEGDGPEHAIEGADPIRHDDESLPIAGI